MNVSRRKRKPDAELSRPASTVPEGWFAIGAIALALGLLGVALSGAGLAAAESVVLGRFLRGEVAFDLSALARSALFWRLALGFVLGSGAGAIITTRLPRPLLQRWNFAGQIMLIMLPVALLYLPAMTGGFIGDDELLVSANTVLRTSPGHTWHGLGEAWLGEKAADYYPLTTTLYWITFRFGGLETFGFHIVNILLHAINALLVWRVLRRLEIPGAWLAGFIFGIHPVHVESVAWISELKNVLATLFYLLAFLAYLDFEEGRLRNRSRNFLLRCAAAIGLVFLLGGLFALIQGSADAGTYGVAFLTIVPPLIGLNFLAQRLSQKLGGRYGYLSALLFFLAALLSKSHVVVLPGVLLLYAWWRHGSSGSDRIQDAREARWIKIVCGALAGLGIIASIVAGIGIWSYRSPAGWQSDFARELPFLVVVALLSAGLGLAAVKYGELFHRFLLRSVPFFQLALMLGALEVCFQHGRAFGDEDISGGAFPRRLANAGMAVWWYLGKVLAPGRLVSVYPNWRFDSPAAAEFVPLFLLIAAAAILWRYRNGWARSVCFAIGYFVIALLPVLGFFKIALIWNNTVVADHFQYLADISIIALLSAAAAAIWQARGRGTKLALVVLGALFLPAMGIYSWDRASTYQSERRMWQDTLAKNPDAWHAHNRVGRSLFEEGKFLEATPHFARAVALRPDNADNHNFLGLGYCREGRFEEGIAEYRKAIELTRHKRSGASRKALRTIQTNIGNALTTMANNLATSAQEFGAHGITLAAETQMTSAARRYEEAVAEYREVLEAEPENAAVHRNLGVVLARLGRFEEAVSHLQSALQLVPGEPFALETLEAIARQRGRSD